MTNRFVLNKACAMNQRIVSRFLHSHLVLAQNETNFPRNILLLRHGQSIGNEDESFYTSIPDWKIPLSNKGRQDALKAGERIQEIIGPNNSVVFYVSPYYRTKQTLEEVRKKITADILFVREEPRLREQDFGNFQDKALMQASKEERVKFGRFFYRFPNGESGADVFDRVSAFCGTLMLDMSQIRDPNVTAVFITHGITARLFIKRWLHWSVDDFEGLHNPPNCGLLHLERVGHNENIAFRLTRESRDLIKAPVEEGIGRGLQFGRALLEQRKRKSARDLAWERLPETAWGV